MVRDNIHHREGTSWTDEKREEFKQPIPSTTASQILSRRFFDDRGRAAWTPRQGLDERDDQASAHCGD
jgi:hypothetical protein